MRRTLGSRASPGRATASRGPTSIVRSPRPDVQIARVLPRTLYQAFVPRARLVPAPDPLFLVARVGDVRWRTHSRGFRGGARGVDDRAARSSLLPSKEGDGGGLFHPRRCLAFVEIVLGCWLNA